MVNSDHTMRQRTRGTPANTLHRGQRGFSLLEIALAMVLLGMLFAGLLKSQSLLDQYRHGAFVNSTRALAAHLSAHLNTRGRWPGDCNRDGLIDYSLLSVTTLSAVDLYDYSSPAALTAASSSSASYAPGNVCPVSTLMPFENVNVPFNELKQAGLLPTGQPSRLAAAHNLGGHAYLGTLTVNTGSNALYLEERFNAIVLTGVPIAAARRLAVAIDGVDGSTANSHRVRRSNDLASFAPLWTASGETEAKRITVVVLFDRVPPPV
jgi:prepilin-type N-terminal cleavage/methylation domain-containing protein